jgi:protein SCO1/2
MPAMTMTYGLSPGVTGPALAPGDRIDATLGIRDAHGTLGAIAKTGSAPVRQGANQTAMAAALLQAGDAVPDAALVDQDDRRRSLAEWTGTLTLITFTYTSCPQPTFCPLMDQNFATIQRAVAEDALLKGRVKLVSISFDPAHDTPAVLKTHAAARGADPAVWSFLTGDVATIDRLAGRFGVSVLRPEGPGEIAHSLRTTLVGVDGRIRKTYGGSDWTPSTVLADLRAAASAQ